MFYLVDYFLSTHASLIKRLQTLRIFCSAIVLLKKQNPYVHLYVVCVTCLLSCACSQACPTKSNLKTSFKISPDCFLTRKLSNIKLLKSYAKLVHQLQDCSTDKSDSAFSMSMTFNCNLEHLNLLLVGPVKKVLNNAWPCVLARFITSGNSKGQSNKFSN